MTRSGMSAVSLIGWGMLAWLAAGAAHAGSDGVGGADKVLACMAANFPPSLRVQHIELDTTDRSGDLLRQDADNGRIAERGCFEDLLLRDGRFAALVASQMTRMEIAPVRPPAQTTDVCHTIMAD